MVYAADSTIPVEQAIVTAAKQLQNLEDEAMNVRGIKIKNFKNKKKNFFNYKIFYKIHTHKY